MKTEQLVPITTGRLLIYENLPEIGRIRGEIEGRARMLNDIAKHGLSEVEIKSICESRCSIDQYIEDQLLKENKENTLMKEAPILGPTVALSDTLQQLKDALIRWETLIPHTRVGDKYQGIITEGNVWMIDEDLLERDLTTRGLKWYIEKEMLKEYEEIKSICEILNLRRCRPGQLRGSTFFDKRIECVGGIGTKPTFTPRPQYFVNQATAQL